MPGQPDARTATTEWHRALTAVMGDGHMVEPDSAGAAWKGRACRELLGFQTRVPMSSPVALSHARSTPKRFMAAEAAWILSGDNRVSTIAPFSAKIKQFSDDGRRFFGAYGPRFVAQLPHVLRSLLADPESRQAVVQVWRESPPDSRDTPCTLSWQYLMRGRHLHCVATMRSSDLITGWPVDVFNFSMTAAAVLLELRRVQGSLWDHVALGDLVLTAGSQHVYRLDFGLAEEVLMVAHPVVELEPLDLGEFDGMDSLTDYLWEAARSGRAPTFLSGLFG